MFNPQKHKIKPKTIFFCIFYSETKIVKNEILKWKNLFKNHKQTSDSFVLSEVYIQLPAEHVKN